MERRSSVNSPLRLFNVSGQLRLHFKQNVKWFATELVKSGYLGNREYFLETESKKIFVPVLL